VNQTGEAELTVLRATSFKRADRHISKKGSAMSSESPMVKVIPGFDPKLPLSGAPGSLESKVKITHHVPEGTVIPTPQEILTEAAQKHHHRTKKELHKKEEEKFAATHGAVGGKVGEPVTALVPQPGDILNGEIVL
jgi:hypothetical protein